jgi:hypothetical protein
MLATKIARPAQVISNGSSSNAFLLPSNGNSFRILIQNVDKFYVL